MTLNVAYFNKLHEAEHIQKAYINMYSFDHNGYHMIS